MVQHPTSYGGYFICVPGTSPIYIHAFWQSSFVVAEIPGTVPHLVSGWYWYHTIPREGTHSLLILSYYFKIICAESSYWLKWRSGQRELLYLTMEGEDMPEFSIWKEYFLFLGGYMCCKVIVWQEG